MWEATIIYFRGFTPLKKRVRGSREECEQEANKLALHYDVHNIKWRKL